MNGRDALYADSSAPAGIIELTFPSHASLHDGPRRAHHASYYDRMNADARYAARRRRQRIGFMTQ